MRDRRRKQGAVPGGAFSAHRTTDMTDTGAPEAERSHQQTTESPALMTRENDGHGPNPIDYGLSPREIEVLSWVAAGMADKEIALRLRIRPKTVSKHLEHIRAKMKCISRTEVGVVAIRQGLIK